MLLHRYQNIDFVLRLDAITGIRLIEKALECQRDERLFQQWVAQLPLMGYSGTFVSFADYRDRITGANIDRRSVADIEQELDEVEKQLQEGGNE